MWPAALMGKCGRVGDAPEVVGTGGIMDYQTSAAFAMHHQRERELVRDIEARRRDRERGHVPPPSAMSRLLGSVTHALDSAATALHLHRGHVARPTH